MVLKPGVMVFEYTRSSGKGTCKESLGNGAGVLQEAEAGKRDLLQSLLSASLTQFVAHEGAGDGVVTLDECGQIDSEQLLILYAHTAIDDAEIDAGRLAEDDGGQGIVDGSARESEGVEAVADNVGGHAWREIAYVVATEDLRAATCG